MNLMLRDSDKAQNQEVRFPSKYVLIGLSLLSIYSTSAIAQQQYVCDETIPATTSPDDFEIVDNNIVIHKPSDLMFARCILSILETDDDVAFSCDNSTSQYGRLSHSEATMYGKFLEISELRGWRLPTTYELNQIHEAQCRSPAVRSEIIRLPAGETGTAYIWTSSEVLSGDPRDSRAWQVHAAEFSLRQQPASADAAAYYVRDIQAEQVSIRTASNIGGNIHPSELVLRKNEEGSLTVEPDDGFTIGAVTGCDGHLNDGVFTITDAQKNCVVSVTFESEALGDDSSLDIILSEIESNMQQLPSGRYIKGCSVFDQMLTSQLNNRYSCPSNASPSTSLYEIETFKISKFPVTVGQFRQFIEFSDYAPDSVTAAGDIRGCATERTGSMGGGGRRNASAFRPSDHNPHLKWDEQDYELLDDHPLTCVSYRDAMAFINWLNSQTGKSYRLPSESEWEYATRGGTQTRYHFGDNAEHRHRCEFGHLLSCRENLDILSPVGQYRPNQFGLFDMVGNVEEWTEDCWPGSSSVTNNTAFTEGDCRYRIARGSSSKSAPESLYGFYRFPVESYLRIQTLGFRLAHD